MAFINNGVVAFAMFHGTVVPGTAGVFHLKLGVAVRFGAVKNHVGFVMVKMPQIAPNVLIITIDGVAVDFGFVLWAGVVGHTASVAHNLEACRAMMFYATWNFPVSRNFR